MQPFVDTNIFLHYLIGFDPERFRQCTDLLGRAEAGELELETSDVIFAEIVWFLERPPFRLSPPEVRDRVVPLLALSGLRLPGRDILGAAFERYAGTKMNFIDAYNTEAMIRRHTTQVYTYDTDFDGVPGLERLEP